MYVWVKGTAISQWVARDTVVEVEQANGKERGDYVLWFLLLVCHPINSLLTALVEPHQS